jgi:predicted CXXCH cytochrome family protein
MSKLKISFSAIIMLIVISMFSTMAFAAAPAAPTGLKAKIDASNNLVVDWEDVTDATGYKVYVNGVEKAAPATSTATFSVTAELLAIKATSESLKLEVSALNATLEESTKNAMTIQGANKDLVGTWQVDDASKDNGIKNANQTGNGVGGQNVNTGVLKSNDMVDNHGEKGAQRTHGEYQNNTNSCASCHQTHTAASKSLLFKDGVYSTCTACHDGTLGFYNVFGNGDKASSAGTFGGTHDGNMSVHLADGAVKMKAAPGGNPNGTGTWDKEFNCASCHSPHGSYSDRLLHYNPNNMAAASPAEGGIKADKVEVVSKTSLNAWIAAKFPNKDTDAGKAARIDPKLKYVGVKGLESDHGLTDSEIPDTDTVIMIYERSVNSSTGVVTFNKTTNPWIYGYPTRGSSGNNHHYYTRFFTADPATILNPGPNPSAGTYPTAKADQVIDHYDYLDDTAHIKYGKGLVYAPASVLDAVTFAEVSRAYVVKLDLMPILDPAKDEAVGQPGHGVFEEGEELTFGTVKITTVNQRALYLGETNKFSTNIKSRWGIATPGTDKVSGWGIAMSGYCASCHTDYLAGSGSPTGTFDKTSYRHSTTSDSYTCVRCHFAHGTDVEIMTDAHVRNKAQVAKDLVDDPTTEISTEQAAVLAKDYLLDKGASSALKRFTNMSVCWSCHTSSKAEQLKNTDSYKYNDGNVMYDPRGIPAIEGKQNWPVAP